jgi:hypothetical protein
MFLEQAIVTQVFKKFQTFAEADSLDRRLGGPQNWSRQCREEK